MAMFVVEHNPRFPPGFEFTAYEEGADPSLVGVGSTACYAVESLLKQLSAAELEEARWAAATFGESSAWMPQILAEIEARA